MVKARVLQGRVVEAATFCNGATSTADVPIVRFPTLPCRRGRLHVTDKSRRLLQVMRSLVMDSHARYQERSV